MIGATALMCLALNVYHEARGEPLAGQVAVAYVTLNRARYFKQDVCDTVFAYKQFSWTNNRFKGETLDPVWKEQYLKPKDEGAWLLAKAVAESASLGYVKNNIGKDVRFYHANYVSPIWNKEKKYLLTIGTHLFYRNMTDEEKANNDVLKNNWRAIWSQLGAGIRAQLVRIEARLAKARGKRSQVGTHRAAPKLGKSKAR